ncbi:pyridoxamine 5'-phosphate oxidase family protein [Irregularibacter muris]|uniref:Pyridoxamine 5'-phosphate oxidase family protein n=1 Tax=Irregularibacter muris TaxID=1796619 RepID=A0AAE3KZ81_9FIRM|nr:MSMEG_1061 family FMN-dependent PPOX-type flavoprotein [Irregularibacter muris]MCR1898800.1 pyridoxamine 5'-phosphate oxidase family protein [Irregularibacter muris]
MKKVNFIEEAITSEKEIREIVGAPHEFIIKKAISIMDEHCRQFISKSPLCFLSTSDAEGNCDVSPRGDGPGAIKVLNPHQLVIPDRLGNRRVDSMLNIVSNPHIGLIFLIPGIEEVLRINGRAYITQNKEILNEMIWENQVPSLGIGVDIEECFFHCPRALKTSNIWHPEKWDKNVDIPSMKEIFYDHLKINGVEIKE